MTIARRFGLARTRTLFTLSALGLLVAMVPRAAMAQEGLAACGDISVGLESTCVTEPPGISCETRCTEPAMRVSCAADLVVTCQPECTQTVIQTEVQVCTDNCVVDCQTTPGEFNCSSSCSFDCGGNCSAACSGSLNRARCRASCEANCSASCGAECNLVLPTLTCEERCRPSCRGVKKAEVTMSCQLACHEREFVTCEERLIQECSTDCQLDQGALFCEGQFVDHDNNLEQCIDALQNLEIRVEGGFSFSTAGGCSLGASTAPAGPLGPLGLALAGLLLLRRRRR